MTNTNNLVPFDIRPELEKRKDLLENVISMCKKKLSEAPEGTIYACPRKNRKTYRYYLKEKETEKNTERNTEKSTEKNTEKQTEKQAEKQTGGSGHFGERYLDKTKDDLKKSLAEKKYYDRLLKTASRERKRIAAFLDVYEGDSLIKAVSSLNDGIKSLITPLIEDDLDYLRKWESGEGCGLGFDEDDSTQFYSNRGERVRSKSEILIANTLDRMNIPYKYEAPLILKNGVTVHPDFTVLNVVKRKEMYWEHLGKMDDPGYVASNIRKYTDYRKEGIIPGVNLIITYESWKEPLGTKEIEKTIRSFLI